MEAYFVYLLKASGILALFFGIYWFFLKKETFFTLNRIFLLGGIFAAFCLPLFTLIRYIETNPLEITDARTVVSGLPILVESARFDWWILLVVIYSGGVVFLSSRLVLQLFSLHRIFRQHPKIHRGSYTYVEVTQPVAPFSFFNRIAYHPNGYSSDELEAVLRHEKVHCRQWHSIDVLLANLVVIFLWPNPLSWWFSENLQQNLEFLADAKAAGRLKHKKKMYQYALLNVSGNRYCASITNNFFNSSIKKRIVMLQKSKSSKAKSLKAILILPALAIFLLSFNTKTVYLPAGLLSQNFSVSAGQEKMIKIALDKGTTEEELSEMKQDLAKKGIDFSYDVVRNERKEIIDIAIEMATIKNKGKRFSASASYANDGMPIAPMTVYYDPEANIFTTGHSENSAFFSHSDDDLEIRIHGGDEKEKTVEIREINGEKTILVNGEEVSEEAYEKLKKSESERDRIRIKRSKKDGNKSVWISRDHEDEHDVEVISSEGDGFFFLNHDGDKAPLYILDGKEVKEKAIRKLDPEKIESIDVSKGEGAIQKYGEKAKDGVVEITTKD